MRQVEALAKQLQAGGNTTGNEPSPTPKRLTNKDYEILQKHLNNSFHTQVKFAVDASGKGKITFPFKNEEELENLIRIFDKLKEE